MRRALAGLALLLAMVGTAWDAQARVVIQVDKAQQRMTEALTAVDRVSQTLAAISIAAGMR